MTISYNLLTCLPDNYRDIETYLGLQNIYIIPLGLKEDEYRHQINRLYQDEAVDACLIAVSADKTNPFRTLDLVQKSNKDVPIVIIVDTQEEVLQAYAKGVDFATVTISGINRRSTGGFSVVLMKLMIRSSAPALENTFLK